MNAKEAASTAKQYILDLFESDSPANVGLEEIELDPNRQEWSVTIGFSRPWDRPNNSLAALARDDGPRRTYKVVRISDSTREVLSVKSREIRA